MGIVKLALIVLAMVFSAAPLPFSDELGPTAMHVVRRRPTLFYLVASDYLSGGAAQELRRVVEGLQEPGVLAGLLFLDYFSGLLLPDAASSLRNFAERVPFFCAMRKQRRVELDERGVDGGVGSVAGVAGGGLRNQRAILLGESKSKKAHPPGKRALSLTWTSNPISSVP